MLDVIGDAMDRLLSVRALVCIHGANASIMFGVFTDTNGDTETVDLMRYTFT